MVSSGKYLTGRNKKTITVISGVLILVTAFVIWRVFTGQSPEAVMQKTIHALEKGDAKALCELADPEELKKTGLTPAKVELLLRSTLWDGGLPRQAYFKRKEDVPVDQGLWGGRWGNKTNTVGLFIVANDHPKNGWHLNLSWLLYSSCVWKYERLGSKAYYKFARENQVVSFRHQSGVYNQPGYFEDLAQNSARR